MKHFWYYEHSEYGQQIVLHDPPSLLLEIQQQLILCKLWGKKTANTIPTKTCIFTIDIIVTTSKANICP